MKAGSALLACLLACAIGIVGCDSGGPVGPSGPERFGAEDMDLDGDGKPDECLVEETAPDSVQLSAELSTSGIVDLATVDGQLIFLVICDYDGDGDLDVLYATGEGGPAFVFIDELDPDRPWGDQADEWRGDQRQLDTIKDLGPDAYVIENDGKGGFSDPKPLSTG